MVAQNKSLRRALGAFRDTVNRWYQDLRGTFNEIRVRRPNWRRADLFRRARSEEPNRESVKVVIPARTARAKSLRKSSPKDFRSEGLELAPPAAYPPSSRSSNSNKSKSNSRAREKSKSNLQYDDGKAAKSKAVFNSLVKHSYA